MTRAAGAAVLPGPARDGVGTSAWVRRHARALVLAALTVIAYFAALNRAQPLLWAVAALLFATLAVGLAWPRWLVRRLSVTRSGPLRAEEGERIVLAVTVRNTGRLPRAMVELVDRLPFVGAATGEVAESVVLGRLAWLPGGVERTLPVPVVAEKRGLYRLGPVGLASRFPLGLAEARQVRHDAEHATLTVYPEVFPIVSLPLVGAPALIHRGSLRLAAGSGTSEFIGLREYRPGDSPRHIHWPSSARSIELMVREFEPQAAAVLCLVLDQHPQGNLGRGRESSFEVAVRIAASIARHAVAVGTPVRLLGHGRARFDIPAACGEAHFERILDTLAVVAADGTRPYAGVLEDASRSVMRGETIVSFHAERPSRAEVPDTLGALALLGGQGAHLLAVRFDPESFADGAPGAPDPVAEGLRELGAHVVTVRRGDDLAALFNA